MSTEQATEQPTADVQRWIGMVKWFNNKAGFGFITVAGTGELAGKDIFAHYSAIRVENQYKYLVQGEYVDFVLHRSENEKHEYHATDITGMLGGPIMCETRRLALAAQSSRTVSREPEQVAEGEDGEFTRVQKKRGPRREPGKSGRPSRPRVARE